MPRAWDESTFVFVSSRSGASLGRIERRMLAVIGALLERGSTVFVICGPRSPLAEQATALGASVAAYRLEAAAYLRAASRLRKYLRRYRPVCVHSTGLRADLLIRWAARDLPVVVVNSIPCGAWPRGGPIRRRLDRRTLSRPDTLLADCEPLIAQLVAAGAPRERLTLDPPSVTVPAVIEESRAAANGLNRVETAETVPLVGFASRLESSRGAEYLIHAANILECRGVEAEVVIAGRGPALGAIRSAAAGVASVRVLGEVPSLPAILRALDVCVFPSVGGGAPTALLEAAVLGRPIVASDVAGIGGLFVPGEEIVLVPPGDPVALADAIAGLIADPERARTMGERARQRAIDAYSSAAAVERYLRMYREFLAR